MRAAAWIFLLLSSLAAAAADPVDDLMRRSGLWKQLGEFEATIQAGITQAQDEGKPLDEPALRNLRRAAAIGYAAERMRSVVRKQLAKDISPREIGEVMQWLGSDVGRRITALEEKASEPAQAQRMAEGAAQALAGLSEPRRKLVDRMVVATQAAEFNASILINTTVGVVRGIELAAPQGTASDADALIARLRARKPAIVEAMKADSAAAFAMVYEPLSDADLERYVRFAESPIGAKYHDATSRAAEIALTDGAQEMGRQISLAARRTEPRTRT